MKRVYESPEVEIEKFIVSNDIMTISVTGGVGDNGEEIEITEF